METTTLILLIVTIVLAIACVVLAVLKWKDYSESDKASITSHLYGIAKTVFDALKDGKLEAGEIRVLFNAVVALIADIQGRHTDEVEAEFDKLDQPTTYTIAQTTE